MKKFTRLFLDKRMLVAIGMGFSSGLPLLLTTSTVQLWYRDAKIDIKTIGLLGLVGLPYSFKVFWSPLLDRFVPPFLGRRRGWLVVTQAGLVAALCGMAMSDPGVDPRPLAFFSLIAAFISATQDIGIDAYLVESFAPETYAMGVQFYVQAYRIAMLVAGGGALILADHFSWRYSYFAMAAFMGVGALTTLWADEPKNVGQPKNLRDAVWLPLQEFLSRPNWLLILAFLALYNFGGNVATALTNVFYADLGFSKTLIGVTAKSFGIGATILGGIVGASFVYQLGLFRSLFVFGVVQAVACLSFAWLDHFVHGGGGAAPWALAVAISLENLGIGLATAAYVAFMGSIVDRRFTATQYALFSSLMALPRNLGSPIAGYLVSSVGWFNFFFVCAAIAVPGLILLVILGRVHFHTRTAPIT